MPAVGLALLISGHRLASPRLMEAGVAVLGCAAAASGAACMLMRRIVFARRGWGFELWVWRGAAALFIGGALIALGAPLVIAASLHAGGTSLAAMTAVVRQRPGIALVPLGLVLLPAGIGALIGFQEAGEVGRGRLWNLVLAIPDRIGGAILTTLGAAALATGAYELLAPEAFDRWLASLLGHPRG
jgi:hypothetical protein